MASPEEVLETWGDDLSKPTRPDGGPAFPEVITDGTYFDRDSEQHYPHTYSYGGMSLRDWFAGMAMQGIIQTSSLLREYITDRTLLGKPTTLSDITTDLSCAAYTYADAMLVERSKTSAKD